METMEKQDDLSGTRVFRVEVTPQDVIDIDGLIVNRVVEMVAEKIAKVLQNDYNDIVSKLLQEAIANLALAESAAPTANVPNDNQRRGLQARYIWRSCGWVRNSGGQCLGESFKRGGQL